MPPVDREVTIQRHYARVWNQFGHAHQTRVGKRRGQVRVILRALPFGQWAFAVSRGDFTTEEEYEKLVSKLVVSLRTKMTKGIIK